MLVEIVDDGEAAARRGAEHIAVAAREAITARGRCLMALSGGSTPERMFVHLSSLDVDWSRVHLFQVDERVAPAGDEARNLTQLMRGLVERLPATPAGVHAMPVESPDLDAAASDYAATILRIAGNPPRFDLVHLGLGEDGHTASLLPGQAGSRADDAMAAATPLYAGFRRLTLTLAVINAARRIVWVVTGARKAAALRRLRDGDRTIPAGLVTSEGAVMVADREAAGGADAALIR